MATCLEHRSNVVRGTTLSGSGWLIDPTNNPDECRVTYVLMCDIGGSIPDVIVRTLTASQPQVIVQVKEAMMQK